MTIVNSGNHYLAAVKGNQNKLCQTVQQQFISEEVFEETNKGHGRIEKRRVSISPIKLEFTEWLEVKTIVKVESQRQLKHKIESSTRYYISDLVRKAQSHVT